MKRIPKMKLSIHGFNDKVGKELNNKVLYEKRVKTVLNYFLARGFEQNRFTVIPFKAANAKSAQDIAKSVADKRMVKFALIEY